MKKEDISNMIIKEQIINETNIQIVICDITKEKVDVIVNAANSYLKHGGGVAWAIIKAGGNIIQKESDEFVKKNGMVSTGSVAVTSGGNLYAKYIIHAVGPIWKGGHYNEDNLLYRAIYNSLQKAQELHTKSIALPAISTGIYGFPKDRAAYIFGKAIREFLKNNPKTSLKIIRLCLLDINTAQIFEKYMKL